MFDEGFHKSGLPMESGIPAQNAPAQSWLTHSEFHFLRACSVALLVTGAAKILSLILAGSCSERDPIFSFITVCGFLLIGGIIELLLASYLWLSKNNPIRLMLVILLGVNFALYRVMLWWIVPGQSCSCLGKVMGQIPQASVILKVMIFVFITGGLFFVIGPTLMASYQLWGPKSRRLARLVACVSLVLLLMPPLQVAYVAFINPQKTMPMRIENWRDKEVKPISWLDLDAVPEDFVRGVIVAEDQRFFNHNGFDWVRNREAVSDWLTKGRSPSGVSTITQQCARSLFLWHGRSWFKKAVEAYYTYWMEIFLSKRRILELYANVIELGPGIYGIEAAARHHFACRADELSSKQATLLVAIMPNPIRWNPRDHELHLRGKQEAVLRAVPNLRLPQELLHQSISTKPEP